MRMQMQMELLYLVSRLIAVLFACCACWWLGRSWRRTAAGVLLHLALKLLLCCICMSAGAGGRRLQECGMADAQLLHLTAGVIAV